MLLEYSFVIRTVLLLAPLRAEAYNLLQGNNMECGIEGEPVYIPPLTDNPCIQCKCSQEKTVSCLKETCPNMGSCPVIQLPKGKWNSCCHKCKQCSYAGQLYDNDEQWISTQDACLAHTCKGGVITTARMQCASTVCQNPVRLPGYCCPVCPKGSLNASDTCVRTQCDATFCQQYRNGCPALDCPKERQWQPPDDCCPQCSLPRTEMVQGVRGSCYFQNEYYQHEQSFRPDPCYLCICRDGNVQCRSFVCKHLDCPTQRLYYRKGVCCPFCRNKDPSPCIYLNETHQHRSSWDLDLCTKCICTNGETRCSTQQCPNSYGCPRGYRLTKVKNKCCPECQEKEAICSVDSDLKIRTYDGYKFQFKASCKYTLTEDCSVDGSKKDFKVIIRNSDDPDNKVRHVSLKLARGLRISLLPGKRVKENRKPVRLPHLRLGVYAVYWDKKNRVVVLRVTKLGLKLTWDGDGALEVSVSPEYKSRLCGICGNYNHDVNDDLMSRWGDLVREPYSMAQSWKFGSYKKCLSDFDQKYHKKFRKDRKRINKEQKLINSAFSWALLNDKPLKMDRIHETGVTSAPELFRTGHNNGLPDQRINETIRNSSQHLTNIISQDETQLNKTTSQANDLSPSLFPSTSTSPVPSRKSPSLFPSTSTSPVPSRKMRHLERLERVCPGGSAKWRTRSNQMQKCMIVKSSAFEQCRTQVSVSRFYWWCMEDACGCPSTGHCYCEALIAYADKCSKLHLPIDEKWKEHTNCAKSVCSVPGAVYTLCALPTACQASCEERTSKQCPCSPGCHCPPGALLHAGKCIPQPLCPPNLSTPPIFV